MKRLLHTTDPEWGELFRTYQQSAYRLECQQIYSSPSQDADVAEFLAGRPVTLDWGSAADVVRQQVALGRPKNKVRIVVEPQTQYTQLELTLYPVLAGYGETIRILTVQQGDWPEGVPGHDYWIFDDRDVWRMHYHQNFRFKIAELIDDPEVVDGYRRARDIAWEQAVPLEDYYAAHPEILERAAS